MNKSVPDLKVTMDSCFFSIEGLNPDNGLVSPKYKLVVDNIASQFFHLHLEATGDSKKQQVVHVAFDHAKIVELHRWLGERLNTLATRAEFEKKHK